MRDMDAQQMARCALLMRVLADCGVPLDDAITTAHHVTYRLGSDTMRWLAVVTRCGLCGGRAHRALVAAGFEGVPQPPAS